MNHLKTILTDVDGVLLDWNLQFNAWMVSQGYIEIDEHTDKYELELRWGMSRKQIDDLVHQFNRSAAIAFLPPWKDAAHYVRRLAERGYHFITCTSMGGDRYSEALRVYNLERIYGRIFTQHHFLPLNTCKREVLGLYAGTGMWWIEDKILNAEDGLSLGLRPILVRHSHNESYEKDDILCARDWQSVFKYITGGEYVE